MDDGKSMWDDCVHNQTTDQVKKKIIINVRGAHKNSPLFYKRTFSPSETEVIMQWE